MIKMGKIIKKLKELWGKVPDRRGRSNRKTYRIADVMMCAFSVFFMQCPSFLSFQRDMKRKKKRSNARTLFGIEKIPCDQQIKNIIDGIEEKEIGSAYKWVISELEERGELESYKCIENTLAVALDGLTYHSSTTIHCEKCSKRRDNQGKSITITMHCYQ